MKFLSFFFSVCFFFLANASDNKTLVPARDAKDQITVLWDDMMKVISSFKKLNRKSTFAWLFDFFSVKEYVTGNPVILTQCLDLLIYELLADVFSLKGMIKFKELEELDEMDFNPPFNYFETLGVRAKLLGDQASVLPSISKTWVQSLCNIQKNALNGIIGKIKAGLPIRVDGSQELADSLNMLCDFRLFYEKHTATGVPLDVELKAALIDSPLLFDLLTNGYSGLKEHPLEFPEASLIPAFLVYHKPARPHLPLKALYTLLLHARKALASFHAEYEDKFHQFNVIRVLSVIPDVFPSMEDKMDRIRRIFTTSRELCINGQPFKDKNWAQRRSILSSAIFGLHLLNNEPSKIKVFSAISDCCMIAIGGIIAEKNPKFIFSVAANLNNAMTLKQIPDRVKLLKSAEETIFEVTNVDAKYWLHYLFELVSICHCAIDEHLKKQDHEPLVAGKTYAMVYKGLHDRMTSQMGSLKALKGEKLFSSGDLFCKNERIRLGLAAPEKSQSIDIKHKNKKHTQIYDPSPSSTSISPQSSISPHEDIDKLVAEIEGPKKPERKPKPQKIKKEPIIFVADEWESSSEDDEDVSETGGETSGNSSPDLDEDPIFDDPIIEGPVVEAAETQGNAHIMSLVDSEDIDLLETIDARDLVYAYLAIGNTVFYRFLSPLITRLQSHQIFLYPVLLNSLKSFESEVQILWMTQKETLKPIFEELGIEGMSFFGNCVKFYGKRLQVAHQHFPMNVDTRKAFAKMHLATLNASVHSFYEKGSEIVTANAHSFNFTPSAHGTIGTSPFSTKDRTGLLAEDDINYELSILGLTGLFKTVRDARQSGGRTSVKLGMIRRPIAHQRPSNLLLAAIINRIFPESHHYIFLRKLLL